MQAPATGFPKPPDSEESPAQALVRLLEQHGLEDSLREILAAIETRKKERQKAARLALLDHLLEGQPPITEAELAAVRDE
jgi:Trp operon repressor